MTPKSWEVTWTDAKTGVTGGASDFTSESEATGWAKRNLSGYLWHIKEVPVAIPEGNWEITWRINGTSIVERKDKFSTEVEARRWVWENYRNAIVISVRRRMLILPRPKREELRIVALDGRLVEQ